jgi:hypothetical protein
LGYFNLERRKAQTERGEYWISRYQINTVLFDDQGWAIDLPRYLHDLKRATVHQQECRVELGVKTRLPAQLLLRALPDAVAGRSRNNGRTASQASLALCDWKILNNPAEPERLSLKDGVLLYSVRWQSELLFKFWKSQRKRGHSYSQNHWRRRCERYAKLPIVIVQHWIILTGLWHIPERSLVKGGQLY